MSAHPIRKLLDLAEAARSVQDDGSDASIQAFDAMMADMIKFESQAATWDIGSDIPLTAHAAMVRGQPNSHNILGINNSLIFEMEDLHLTISVYRENVIGSLKLQCDINNPDWMHAAALLYQSNMLIDTSWVDREGEFILTAMMTGEARIKLRSTSGQQIVLSAIEIEP
jgi:hypothetical protein